MIAAPGQSYCTAFAGVVAVALTTLLLLSPVLLKQKTLPKTVEELHAAVSLRNLMPPPPPEQEEVQQKPEEQKPEPIRHVTLAMQQPQPPKQPPMQLESLQFDIPMSLAQGVSIALPRNTGVLSLGDVDEPPVPLYTPAPSYPQKAKRKRLETKVVIKMIVTADGKVQQARIVQGEHLDVFSKPALAAISKWRFSPAKLHGKAVAVIVNLPLEFQCTN